jgi:hypothetical protein
MAKVAHILVLTCSVFVALAVFAQPRGNADAAWREKMKAANKEGEYEPSALREALKIAEGSGETDVRLFETVIKLAAACEYNDACGDQTGRYLDRALHMRAKVKPAD